MPKTIQIRDLDDDLYSALAVRAAAANLSVPGLLRREAIRLVSQPSVADWLERTRRRVSPSSTPQVIDALGALDGLRGGWPEADR